MSSRRSFLQKSSHLAGAIAVGMMPVAQQLCIADTAIHPHCSTGPGMNDIDARLLRESFEVARLARQAGNHPFGAVLGDCGGNVLLREQNTVLTSGDCTGHAELNLVRAAVKKFPVETLAQCTIYASTEPCPMCAGGIFWANIGRLLYGLSEEGLYALTGDTPYKLLLSCRDVFSRGARKVEVVGPLLEAEALQPQKGFWKPVASDSPAQPHK